MGLESDIKYSILIPVLNGMPYLRSCIDSVLSMPNSEIEVIVSDNGSSDGSRQFLQEISDTRLRLLTPDERLSMSDHWEYLLGFASGTWQMFIGQDDALQQDFFSIAETLTAFADEKQVRTISTRRAYYFWPGAESASSGARVRYIAKGTIRLVDAKAAAHDVLSGRTGYFDLPHMYTSSMFNRSIIEECRSRFDGVVIQGHPQDAFLAAIACALDSHFVRAEVPLGWVGTSPKSAGLAVSGDLDKLDRISGALRQDYLAKIHDSPTSKRLGMVAFDLDLGSLYFWEAVDTLYSNSSSDLHRRFLEEYPVDQTIIRGSLAQQKKINIEALAALTGKPVGLFSAWTLHLVAIWSRLVGALLTMIRTAILTFFRVLRFRYYILLIPLTKTPSLKAVNLKVHLSYTHSLRWSGLH